MKAKFTSVITFLCVCIIAFAATFIVGCAPGGGDSEEVIKIGAILSVTGRGSPIGEPEKDTTLMLEEQINNAGGINGKKIKIIMEDTEGNETKAMMAAKKLIEKDNVTAIIGPSLSGTTLAIANYIEEAGVPMVSCAASIKITDPVKKWIFKVAFSDRHSVSKILTYLSEKGINKVALIYDSNAYGSSGKDELLQLAPQRGFEVVAQETFNGDDTDMTAQLTHIKGTEAEAIICWGTNPGPAVITRNMKQLKMELPLVQSHGVANEKYIELSGDAANGVIMPAGRMIVTEQLPDTDPQKSVLLEYKKAFEAKYNRAPDHYGGHAYDAVLLVVNAIEKVGLDKAAIRQEIENTKDFVGTDGIFNFSAEDHNGLSENALVMVGVENGNWKLMEK
ncbi:MAG TPA: ABC transporter substrate-binding protein [bacterium]|nr:ABC transporter substrate-binding protein [bacterium]